MAVLSTGAIFDEVSEAYEMLCQEGIFPAVYTFPTVKPIDEGKIRQCAREFDLIVTCEEHNIVGGFGSAVAEVMAEAGEKAKLMRIGIQDEYSVLVGSQKYLRGQYGLDGRSIADKIMKN